jgi:hypothetical protein
MTTEVSRWNLSLYISEHAKIVSVLGTTPLPQDVHSELSKAKGNYEYAIWSLMGKLLPRVRA